MRSSTPARQVEAGNIAPVRGCDDGIVIDPPPIAGQAAEHAPDRPPSPDLGRWMRCTMAAVALRFIVLAPHPGE
jgi:hypothetical protein